MITTEVIEVDHENELVAATPENGCAPGELCLVEDYFEMISICALCGKLL